MSKPKPKVKPFTPASMKKLAANPGTRSTIPDRLLPKQYRAEREKNRRLDSPVAPGSGLTFRQLGRDTSTYMTVKYGPGDLAERKGIQQQEAVNRDTSGWYQQYLNDLRTHAANINTFADQNVAQTQQLGQGIASVGQRALAGQAGAPSQQINAAAADTRARYAGSFAGQASAIGTANKNYASNLANVVGPGQALNARLGGVRAVTDLREKATVRADVKGADAAQYRSGRITDEQKILAASAIAQGKSLTSIRTAQIRADATTTAARTSAGSKTPPVPYYTWAQWKSMTPAQKRAAVKDYQKVKTKPGKPAKPTSPYDFAAPATQQKLAGSFGDVRNAFTTAKKGGQPVLDKKTGKPVKGQWQIPPLPPGTNSDRAYRIMRQYAPPGTLPVVVRAAAEVSIDGYIHAATVHALQVAGIKVAQLGVDTGRRGHRANS